MCGTLQGGELGCVHDIWVCCVRGLSRASTPRSAHDPSSCVSGARTQVMCPQIRVYAECGGGDEGKDDGNGGKFIPEGSIRDYKLGATVYVKSDAGEWIGFAPRNL